jgi:hypothetical protein
MRGSWERTTASARRPYRAILTLPIRFILPIRRLWLSDPKGVEIGGFDMQVQQLDPARRVLWQVVDGPEEWNGTRISFDLKQDGDYSIVLFKHQDWKEPVEFMHHCSTKWALFLMSLKSLLETGAGAPSPNDVKIDNWN